MYLIPSISSLPVALFDDLDDEKKRIYEEFKRICTEEKIFDPERHDPVALLRFLKARSFKIDQAKKMWIDTLNWRKANNVDNLVNEFKFTEEEDVKKYYIKFYHKVDNEGRPVYYEYLGSINVKMLYELTTPERMLKNHICEYERLTMEKFPAASIFLKKQITQSCTVLNLKGVHISDFSSVYSLVKTISRVSQDHYPEILGRMFIINSPLLFTATWTLIKGMLDETTTKKITVHGSDYLNHLLKFIPAENIPANLGGKCSCPNGCENSDIGPWKT